MMRPVPPADTARVYAFHTTRLSDLPDEDIDPDCTDPACPLAPWHDDDCAVGAADTGSVLVAVVLLVAVVVGLGLLAALGFAELHRHVCSLWADAGQPLADCGVQR